MRSVTGLNVKEEWRIEVIRCPNPKCRRRILDDEETEWTVLEIKCQHCGKLVRMYCGSNVDVGH